MSNNSQWFNRRRIRTAKSFSIFDPSYANGLLNLSTYRNE